MLVGKIETKDELIIGDPCYDLGSLELGRIKDIVPGVYNCSIEYSKEKRVSMIEIKHEDVLEKASDICTVENEFWIAVDSGQVGFFDFTFYKNYSDNQKNREGEIIYNEICNKILSRDKYGVNSKYFVSSSGYGDGEYDVCVVRNSDRKVIGVLIEFIKEAGDDE
ncbi:DUF4241 domain-containing protein [Fusobacterium varium]|uniref:DUF4241 domain-containing protein n=1 Tax=Fusobacterium varium TaxID=856 RepID=UPI00242EAD8E|nr:DUF4241 domain-containing protein [Fusobacterium varium]